MSVRVALALWLLALISASAGGALVAADQAFFGSALFSAGALVLTWVASWQ